MSVAKKGPQFYHQYFSREQQSVAAQISKLVIQLAENLNRADAVASDEQLREIKKFEKSRTAGRSEGNLEKNAVDKTKESRKYFTAHKSLSYKQITVNLVGKR